MFKPFITEPAASDDAGRVDVLSRVSAAGCGFVVLSVDDEEMDCADRHRRDVHTCSARIDLAACVRSIIVAMSDYRLLFRVVSLGMPAVRAYRSREMSVMSMCLHRSTVWMDAARSCELDLHVQVWRMCTSHSQSSDVTAITSTLLTVRTRGRLSRLPRPQACSCFTSGTANRRMSHRDNVLPR